MVVVGIAALMLLTVQVVLAYAPVDSVDVGPFKVDLVTYTVGSDDVSNWVYAVTTVPTQTDVNALSHWVLGFDLNCYEVVEPVTVVSTLSQEQCNAYTDGTSYYTCQEDTYDVEYGTDPTTDLYGVKWDIVGEDGLKPGAKALTHMFELKLYATEHYIGDASVAVKYGTNKDIATIAGPVCDTSAVDVTSLSAAPGGRWALTLVVVGLMTIALMGTSRVVRQRD
jgi:methionine-rich copper-binding protein CopC